MTHQLQLNQWELSEVLSDHIQKVKTISWKDIVDYVTNNLEQKIDNWMFVRGAIQILLNENKLVRDKDVHKEVYHHLHNSF